MQPNRLPNDSTHPEPPLTLTQRAVDKISECLQEEQGQALLLGKDAAAPKLRISINGGGCHGFKYDFDIVSEVAEDDIVIRMGAGAVANPSAQAEVELVLDPISLQYLKGAEVDYQSGLQGECLVIRHLRFKSVCGCGASFAIADENSPAAP